MCKYSEGNKCIRGFNIPTDCGVICFLYQCTRDSYLPSQLHVITAGEIFMCIYFPPTFLHTHSQGICLACLLCLALLHDEKINI